MYLLKHATGAPTNSIIEFTFHYVSIKTMKILFFTLYLLHLHSTMYLLKLPAISKITSFYSVFTFHYVSIKTISTCVPISSPDEFTFHYVSIKTVIEFLLQVVIHLFTFHYVSIKTDCDTANLTIVIFTFHYVSIKTISPTI